MFKYYIDGKLVNESEFLTELTNLKCTEIKDPDVAAKLAGKLMTNMEREAETWGFPAIQIIGRYPAIAEFTVVKEDDLAEWVAAPKNSSTAESVWSYDVVDADNRVVISGYEENSDGTYEMISDFKKTKDYATIAANRHIDELLAEDEFWADPMECDIIPKEIPIKDCSPVTLQALKAMGLL